MGINSRVHMEWFPSVQKPLYNILLNLFDNYRPLVLSIYSVTFPQLPQLLECNDFCLHDVLLHEKEALQHITIGMDCKCTILETDMPRSLQHTRMIHNGNG